MKQTIIRCNQRHNCRWDVGVATVSQKQTGSHGQNAAHGSSFADHCFSQTFSSQISAKKENFSQNYGNQTH